jgi:hypothetical protein
MDYDRPGCGVSERRAYSVGVNAVEACREPWEQAAVVLAMRWNPSSQERGPKEGANESSPEASDHPYRVQRHLIVKMMVVRAGRRASYLGAAWDEQP